MTARTLYQPKHMVKSDSNSGVARSINNTTNNRFVRGIWWKDVSGKEAYMVLVLSGIDKISISDSDGDLHLDSVNSANSEIVYSTHFAIRPSSHYLLVGAGKDKFLIPRSDKAHDHLLKSNDATAKDSVMGRKLTGAIDVYMKVIKKTIEDIDAIITTLGKSEQ